MNEDEEDGDEDDVEFNFECVALILLFIVVNQTGWNRHRESPRPRTAKFKEVTLNVQGAANRTELGRR